MKVIEYLNALGNEYALRAKRELDLTVSVTFGENETGGFAVVQDAEGRGISLQMGHSLMEQDDVFYIPRVEEDMWKLFLMEVKPWRFADGSD